MAADNEVIIEVIARLDKAEASLKKFEGSAKSSGEKGGKDFGDGFKDAATFGFKALAVAAAAALAGVALVLKKSIAEAVEQQEAVNDLNSALARTGQYSQAASLDIQKFADSLENASVFSGDQILSNAALIQSLGKLSTDGLKQATQAAADLAATLNIDLHAASQLIGKAAAGNIGAFSRYGIVIKEGATNAETFANTLNALASQQGAAASKLNTFGGAMTQLGLSFDKVLETIGDFIIKSPELVSIVRYISGFFVKLADDIKLAAGNFGLRGFLLAAVDVASFFTSVLGPVFDVIANVIGSIGRSIGGLAAALVQFASGDFRAALETLTITATEGMDDVKTVFETKGTDAAMGFVEGLRKAIETAPPVASDAITNKLTPAITEAKFGMIGLAEQVSNSFKATALTIEGIGTTLRQSVGQGLTNSFAAMGAALAKGENGFSAFAKTALGAIGDIAIQMGSMLMLAGFGWSVIPGFQASAGAVGAGIGLMILGGALKALAGGGSSSAPSGAAGGSATSSPVGSSVSSLQEPQRPDPTTGVTVNVQGNVFDNRETGLAIAQVINESFATGGLVLAGGAVV